MNFARKPENDFAHFIYMYYEKCRSCFDRIEAIAGKWMFRDLIPGMSDFDTRFIVRDDMTADDWCRMSTVIGEAHLALCETFVCWARNLEHLPGVNLTWSELTAEKTYYPEYQQWSFYHSKYPAKVSSALETFAKRPWGLKDEYFHLKKFCSLYGKYNRSIDPPINLGIHESKYPLHSRLMHYFTPAILSAGCLLARRNIPGKFDALEIVQRQFPGLTCWRVVEEILHSNYELPRWYREPFLSELEDQLETGLHVIAAKLRLCLTLIPGNVGTDVAAWKKALQSAPIDHALIICESARFSRLMKGRLLFYAKAPAHFDTSRLIEVELNRIGRSLFHIPFTTFWKVKSDQSVLQPLAILDSLCGDVLTYAEVSATKEFARLTQGHRKDIPNKETVLAIVDVFDDFYKALAKISEAVYQAEVSDGNR